MKIKITFFSLLAVFFFCGGCASLSDSGDLYRKSLQDIRDDRAYFAALNLQSILKDDPKSPYASTAAFALGEYYLDNFDYFNAIKTLSDYIHNYPKHKGIVFAKLIIYKILTGVKKEVSFSTQEDALIKEIRKELFSQPLFLIFYDKKAPRSYNSLFHHTYLVYDYVDKIKVFRDEKIFLELSP